MIKTYKLKHYLNNDKEQTILDTFEHYRKLSVQLAKIQWHHFYQHKCFNKNLDIKHVNTILSERYKQTAQYQTVSILKSFIENIKLKFKAIINKYDFDTTTKIQLLYINKYGHWFRNDIKMKDIDIPLETIKLARSIFKQLLKLNKLPNLSKVNMNLDVKEAVISKSRKGEFDYWIKLSTHLKGQPIEVPLKSNRFFESKIGTLKNFVQVNLDKHNKLSFCLIKDVIKRKYETTGEVIALDIGLINLLTTNHGDLFGRQIYGHLKEVDGVLVALVSALQARGLKPSQSQRYTSTVNKVKAYLKNEVCRIVNRVIELYKPGMIVIEDLNFQNQGLSRRLNRIIGNFGLGTLHKKLDAIAEEFSVEIVKVNPTYTSQECNKCHYVAKENRVNRDRFECRLCGRKAHADVNGSRNVIARSSCGDITVYIKRKKILDILRVSNNQYIERNPCLNRRAMSLGIFRVAETPPLKKFCSVVVA